MVKNAVQLWFTVGLSSTSGTLHAIPIGEHKGAFPTWPPQLGNPSSPANENTWLALEVAKNLHRGLKDVDERKMQFKIRASQTTPYQLMLGETREMEDGTKSQCPSRYGQRTQIVSVDIFAISMLRNSFSRKSPKSSTSLTYSGSLRCFLVCSIFIEQEFGIKALHFEAFFSFMFTNLLELSPISDASSSEIFLDSQVQMTLLGQTPGREAWKPRSKDSEPISLFFILTSRILDTELLTPSIDL